MGYLIKIIVGSRKTKSQGFSANRPSTALLAAELGKTSHHESEMGSLSRLQSDDGTRAVFTNAAIGTSDVSSELESSVSVNVIRVQDSIEQFRTPRI